MVEGARLESVYTVKGIKGSNPFLSAKIKFILIEVYFYRYQRKKLAKPKVLNIC